MPRTVHVIPKDEQWVVTREGAKSARVYSTQRQAIEDAKGILRQETSGQLVVHRRNGQIRQYRAYGMPPIQDPPGKRSAKIEKAVGKITRGRLFAEPVPARG